MISSSSRMLGVIGPRRTASRTGVSVIYSGHWGDGIKTESSGGIEEDDNK